MVTTGAIPVSPFLSCAVPVGTARSVGPGDRAHLTAGRTRRPMRCAPPEVRPGLPCGRRTREFLAGSRAPRRADLPGRPVVYAVRGVRAARQPAAAAYARGWAWR